MGRVAYNSPQLFWVPIPLCINIQPIDTQDSGRYIRYFSWIWIDYEFPQQPQNAGMVVVGKSNKIILHN
jgi:hypothetical protein